MAKKTTTKIKTPHCQRNNRPGNDLKIPARRLFYACIQLNEIVEGVRHQRWAVNGCRFKDTP